MDHASAHDLRQLSVVVQRIAHDLSNVLGVAINYTMFLGEDLAEAAVRSAPGAGAGAAAGVAGSTGRSVASDLPQIEAALARAVELVRELQARVPQVDLANQQVEADRAQHGER
jgi:hypothetical protein